ncbi:MAG TPA: DISARM system helicase DrmA, partial [Dermatophilaceae bacterium]|nr:DISARM system helicase DrmA [Dermatophilaceae bacterium]
RPTDGDGDGVAECDRGPVEETLQPATYAVTSGADAAEVIESAESVRARLAAGIEHVVTTPDALACFRFMNEVMRDQRIHTQVAERRAKDTSVDLAGARAAIVAAGPSVASWRPFQLAFILMQLPALSDPADPRRSGDYADVELLFFPTGGGKTEAYLGLAAYTFANRRRLRGVINSPDGLDGRLDGRDGVAVLMRYTLRLLTAQQFQRATALVCAAELARRRDPAAWGAEPFRIGLWVGTDVSPKRYEEAKEQLAKHNAYGGHRLTVLQVKRCPWCGTPIDGANVKAVDTTRRVHVYCGDQLARCPFSEGGTVEGGLPILTVDEEIYRLTPDFVIATVDKFARLAREGEAASLFGYVARRCQRHGYVHPDSAACDITTAHPAKDGFAKATVHPVTRLRPPDLIIQDELHLITGALGTAVGLFEVAVETLCSWRTGAGLPVKPLVVASTATVRNAEPQVRGLYGRGVEIFPPQVLDVADTFFATELPLTPATPGRRYVGVSAQGVRLPAAEIRIAEVLMSAGQLLLDRCGADADPYMTLVGYFNATRELAGMTRYMGDDIRTRIRRPRQGSGFPPRYGAFYSTLRTGELTARISSADIGAILDDLAVGFDPAIYTTAATAARVAATPAGPAGAPSRAPYDVMLATSMLQVGVDVQRLGLMLVVGQPKNTAEYIQASSRVGRDASARPGLVVALGNWARPRDLAHFEQFRHYHETFYAQVEALSVTPYSATALERGLDGVLVSAARVMQAHLAGGLSPEAGAEAIVDQRPAVEALIAALRPRIERAAQLDAVTDYAMLRLTNRLDQWSARLGVAHQEHKRLVYERAGDGTKLKALLVSPENAKANVGVAAKAPFVVANSMREVQPEINLLVSPLPENLFAAGPGDAPAWVLPEPPEEQPS